MKSGKPKKRMCSSCYFSRVIADSLHCVRNSPDIDYSTGQAFWPIVKEDDICGQFRYAEDNPIGQDHWPRGDLPIYTDRFGDYCKIPLTHGQFAKVDPEDYIWLAQWKWYCQKSSHNCYAVRQIKSKNYRAMIFIHRLVMNTPDNMVCDHINHNGLDNRKANLRNCTFKQNCANSRSRRNSVSKYKGVSWSRQLNKWSVSIKADGKSKALGYFTSETAAAKAYDKAAKKHYGDFANLNFPH